MINKIIILAVIVSTLLTVFIEVKKVNAEGSPFTFDKETTHFLIERDLLDDPLNGYYQSRTFWTYTENQEIRTIKIKNFGVPNYKNTATMTLGRNSGLYCGVLNYKATHPLYNYRFIIHEDLTIRLSSCEWSYIQYDYLIRDITATFENFFIDEFGGIPDDYNYNYITSPWTVGN